MSAETSPELSATPSSGRSNTRAAGIAVLAFAVFSGADALIKKLLAIDLPAPHITLITTIVGLMLLLAYAAARGRLRNLMPRCPCLSVSRALPLGADAILIHYAFKLLPRSRKPISSLSSPDPGGSAELPSLGRATVVSCLAWGSFSVLSALRWRCDPAPPNSISATSPPSSRRSSSHFRCYCCDAPRLRKPIKH